MGETMVTHDSRVDHGTSGTGSVEPWDSRISSRAQAVTTAKYRQRRAPEHRAPQRSPLMTARLSLSQRTAATRPMTSRSPLDSDVATPRSDTLSPGGHIFIASRAVR